MLMDKTHQYEEKLIEQLEEYIKKFERALINGAYSVIDHTIKKIGQLVEELYEHTPYKKEAGYLIKAAHWAKKTKTSDGLRSAFNTIKQKYGIK